MEKNDPKETAAIAGIPFFSVVFLLATGKNDTQWKKAVDGIPFFSIIFHQQWKN